MLFWKNKKILDFILLFSALKFASLIIVFFAAESFGENAFRYDDFSGFIDRGSSFWQVNYLYELFVNLVAGSGYPLPISLILNAVSDLSIGIALILIFPEATKLTFVCYAIFLGLNPYDSLYYFKCDPGMILPIGFCGALLFHRLPGHSNRTMVFSMLLALCVWRAQFAVSLAALFVIKSFSQRTWSAFLHATLLIALSAWYSMIYAPRAFLGAEHYGNSVFSPENNPFAEILLNGIRLIGFREKYYTLGIETFFSEPLLIQIFLVGFGIFNFVSLATLAVFAVFKDRRYAYLLALFAPLAMSLISVSHLRYLIPFFPILYFPISIVMANMIPKVTRARWS